MQVTKQDVLTDEAFYYDAKSDCIISLREYVIAAEVRMSEAPKGKVVNSVGAGDSMVAGFIYGYLKYQDYDEAFRYGLATGSASAFSEELATNEQVISLYKETWGEKL